MLDRDAWALRSAGSRWGDDGRGDRSARASVNRWFRTGAALAFALGSLVLARPSPVAAEDPCPPDAPRRVAAVEGHTWTGTVRIAAPTGNSKLGVDDWHITFDVDTVYADRIDPDLPTLPMTAGEPLVLPSNTCGRPGDMALRVGRRYLVSTSSYGDGTAIGSIVAWELDGDRATLVTAMYKTAAIGPEFLAVGDLQGALALVVPDGASAEPGAETNEPDAASSSPGVPSASAAAAPSLTPPGPDRNGGVDASLVVPAVGIAILVVSGLLIWGIRKSVRRGREGEP
jgi:hypothetical protein